MLIVSLLMNTQKMSPIYNFVFLSLAHLLANVYLFDPCNVPLKDRRDCGFHGITGATCETFGKLSIVTRDLGVFLRISMFTCTVLITSWMVFRKSGFPPIVGVLYAGFALSTVFTATRCCHDSTVGSGPHCYY